MHMYLASYTLIVGIGHIVRAHTVYQWLAEVTTMLVQLWFTTHAQHLTRLLPSYYNRGYGARQLEPSLSRERERERERERGGDTPFTMYVHVHV